MGKSLKVQILEKVKVSQEADEKARVEGKASKFPPKIEAIAKYLNLHGHGFECQEPNVRGLIEVLLDQPKGTFDKEKDLPPWPVGTIVVPLANPNSHNYPLNQPAMIWVKSLYTGYGPQALRMGGLQGNYLPDPKRHPGAVRLATPDEAEAFVDSLTSKQKHEIVGKLRVLA